MLAICHLSIVPIRKESSDRSEQVTQLLFGDLVEILETNGNWQQIRILDDNYVGWVDKRQIQPISDEIAILVNNSPALYTASITGALQSGLRPITQVVLGSKLPLSGIQTGQMLWGPLHYSGPTIQPHRPDQEMIIHFSSLYQGSPYQWGGKSPFGIDCSGFSQMVFKLNGISLPRDAWQQAQLGQVVESGEQLKVGDLAFFSNAEGKVVHVGIILENNIIAHASGHVRMDTLTNEGIVNAESGLQSHQLCCIKRFF